MKFTIHLLDRTLAKRVKLAKYGTEYGLTGLAIERALETPSTSKWSYSGLKEAQRKRDGPRK